MMIMKSPAPCVSRVREKYDGPKNVDYDGCGEGEPVMWFRQTIGKSTQLKISRISHLTYFPIGHACGLYSLIHAVGNGSAKQFIHPDSLIDRLLKEALPLKQTPRADVLYNSEELEKAHMASAVKGDSHVPSAEEPVGYHFITFVKGKDGNLWELEGCCNPINRGSLDDTEDMLSEKALDLGVRKHLHEAKDGNMEFSIVALATSPD